MPANVPGFHGRYLRIDLTTGSSEEISISADALRRFIGGSGLATYLLSNENAFAYQPYDPAAALCFAFSSLVGSPLTTSAKFSVVSKSPLTGRLNDSLSSSHFAIAGKRTGFDAIMIVGKADQPTLLKITDRGVEFEDASALWGMTIPQTHSHLKKHLAAGFRTAVIGPAGERLVRYATISNDGRHAGRGGSGAVMGSRNLKAIAVNGDRRTEYARPDRLIEYSRDLSRRSFGPATAKYRELGTVSNLLTFNRLGTLPTRNFQSGSFAGAESLALETLSSTHKRTRSSCAACTIGCEHIFHRSGSDTGVRMEYESLFALGSLCGISDPDTVLAASGLCDELGLDTISAGGTIAFAMECSEKGLIDQQLNFGDGPALLKTLRQIAERESFGDLLAEGSRLAAHSIGQGSIDFAPQIKGLEIPGYEPRALQTMALGFAVNTRGADHNRSGAYQVDFSEGVDRFNIGRAEVKAAIETEDEAAVMDSLILCKFLRGVFDDRMESMAEMLGLITGWDTNAIELKAAADRIVGLKKQFNINSGWTPDEDTLPKRFFAEELGNSGPGAGALLNADRLQSLIREYNLCRGWNADGTIPA
jgi:aldehyde:ferredoxin oxidoreductase